MMVCFTLLHSQTTTDETLEPRTWEAEGALGKLLTLGREWLFSLVPHVISKIDRVQLPVCKWSEPVVNGLYCLMFRVLVCHAASTVPLPYALLVKAYQSSHVFAVSTSSALVLSS